MITLDSILYKLTHGVPPLTHAECCWLYTQATGEYVPTSRRCKACEGFGSMHAWGQDRACKRCGGSGKETEANSQK